MTISIAWDVILCVLILVLAYGTLAARKLFDGIALFMAFGLIMALAWARLNAPDLALTEAALGAGILGALFLGALVTVRDGSEPCTRKRSVVTRGIALLVAAALTCLILLRLPAIWLDAQADLSSVAHAALHETGVSNPVTAVILNYRAYDTFLEMVVLLLVVLCVQALLPQAVYQRPAHPETDPLLHGYVRHLAPVMVLAAGYLLWAGADRPGGAFQAGAILASAFVLLVITRLVTYIDLGPLVRRLALVSGVVVFGLAGLLAVASGHAFLTWRGSTGKQLILLIEIAATFSIGLILASLFAACIARLGPLGGAPQQPGDTSR